MVLFGFADGFWHEIPNEFENLVLAQELACFVRRAVASAVTEDCSLFDQREDDRVQVFVCSSDGTVEVLCQGRLDFFTSVADSLDVATEDHEEDTEFEHLLLLRVVLVDLGEHLRGAGDVGGVPVGIRCVEHSEAQFCLWIHDVDGCVDDFFSLGNKAFFGRFATSEHRAQKDARDDRRKNSSCTRKNFCIPVHGSSLVCEL